MKKLFYIFGFLFLFCLSHLNAVDYAPKDTVRLEPLSFDSVTYQEFKTQKQFDYYNQHPDEPNWIQKWKNGFYRWLTDRLSYNLTEKQFENILIFGLIVLLILIVVFLFIFKPSLFYMNRKQKLDYQIENEDIEGYNFERLIQEALNKEEYSDAIRWTYLRILKTLNQAELISFDSNKTVNEYVYEIKRNDLKSDFKNLSQQFLLPSIQIQVSHTLSVYNELHEKITVEFVRPVYYQNRDNLLYLLHHQQFWGKFVQV